MNKKAIYSGLRTWAIAVISFVIEFIVLGAFDLACAPMTIMDTAAIFGIVPVLFAIFRIFCFYADNEEDE